MPVPAPLRRLRQVPLEAFVWLGGLVVLACTDPSAEPLVDLCLFKRLGFEGCPGCGLGHAVAHLFRGEWAASWAAHPLGAPAVGVLAARIVQLLRPALRSPR